MRRRAARDARLLRRAVEPYLDIPALRRLAATDRTALREALRQDTPPVEIVALLEVLSALLYPDPREPVRSAEEVVALLMAEMSGLRQEQMRVICLDTKNHIQTIQTLYQGHLHAATVRLCEFFHEAIRRNSGAILLVHNHPSGDPTPSPEDILVTRRVLALGKALDIDVLDHIVIGRGRWASIRHSTPVGSGRRTDR